MTATNTTDSDTAADLIKILNTWRPVNQGQWELKEEYEQFLTEHGPAAIDRSAGGQHITASSFIFTEDFTRVLLCYHRKGQFWVQLGGHIDPDDASVAGAALREAVEESGLRGLRLLSEQPIDLNRHALPRAFGACKVHWDLGYGFLAQPNEKIVVSMESEDVAWWPVDELPEQIPQDFTQRLTMALTELKTRMGGALS